MPQTKEALRPQALKTQRHLQRRPREKRVPKKGQVEARPKGSKKIQNDRQEEKNPAVLERYMLLITLKLMSIE